MCNKSFKTKFALAQHESSAHATAPTKARTQVRPGQNGGGIRNTNPYTELTAQGVSGVAKNGSTVNKLRKLLPNDLGTTEHGREWALKVLHPMGEGNNRTVGIPDTTNLPVAVPEMRTEFTVNAPKTLAGAALPSDQNWDCVILVPDSTEIAALIMTKPSNVSWADLRAALNLPTVVCTPPQFVYHALFDPAVGDVTTNHIADKYRHTHKGCSIHMDSNFISNQGKVFADHWPVDFSPISLTAAETGTSAVRATLHRLPDLSSGAMVQRSPRVYVNNAREGTYVVMYPVQATVAIPYHDIAADQVPEGATGEGNAWMMFNYPDESAVLTDAVIGDKAHLKYMSSATSRYAQGGFSCGIINIQGLASTANLFAKSFAGIEMVPTSSSAVQAFTGPSPLLDRTALDAVARVAQQSPGAYPVSYNDLSQILGTVYDTIKGITTPVNEIAKFAGSTGIPVISDIGNFIKGITGLFG
jgi:hypothetical protein